MAQLSNQSDGINLSKFVSEGTITFVLSHPNANWYRDKAHYSFGVSGNDLVRITCQKLVNGCLELNLIGAHRKWFQFLEKIPFCPNNKLHVVVTWSSRAVVLYLNGTMIKTLDPQEEFCLKNDSIELLADLLGRPWVDSKLDLIKPANIKPIQDQKIHPFINFYSRYKYLTNEDKLKSIEAPFYRQLHSVLAASKNINGFEIVMKNLYNEATFSDTVSEMILAAFFKESGATVEFKTPGGQEGKRTSDLFWLTSDNTQVPVECKHVRAYSSILEKASRRWPTITRAIEKKIRSFPHSYDVYVRFNDMPSDEMTVSVCDKLGIGTPSSEWQLIVQENDFEIWTKTSTIGDLKYCHITMPEIADWDRIYIELKALANSGQIELVAPDSTHRGPAVLIAKVKEANGIIRNPIAIGLELNRPRLNISNFISLFKSSIGQIDQGGPGIVGVHLPQPSKSELAEYIEWIENEFHKGNYKRVIRVYLFWISEAYERHVINGGFYINPVNKMLFHIVNNQNSNVKLNGMPNP